MADIAKEQCITLSLECNPHGFACARLPDATRYFNPFYAQTGMSKITRHEPGGYLFPVHVYKLSSVSALRFWFGGRDRPSV